jgi:hypothetical protein
MSSKQLKALTKADHVSLVFGEWFDKINGNTYYDALVYVGDEVHEVAYQYGYNAGDKQAIDEALAAVGYRVRACKGNVHQPYSHIHTSCMPKLKRELYK